MQTARHTARSPPTIVNSPSHAAPCRGCRRHSARQLLALAVPVIPVARGASWSRSSVVSDWCREHLRPALRTALLSGAALQHKGNGNTLSGVPMPRSLCAGHLAPIFPPQGLGAFCHYFLCRYNRFTVHSAQSRKVTFPTQEAHSSCYPKHTYGAQSDSRGASAQLRGPAATELMHRAA